MHIIPKAATTATTALLAAALGLAGSATAGTGVGGEAGGEVRIVYGNTGGQSNTAGSLRAQAIGPIGPIIPAPAPRPRRTSHLIIRNGGGRTLAELEVEYCGCSHRTARDWAWQIRRTFYASSHWTPDTRLRGPLLVRVAG